MTKTKKIDFDLNNQDLNPLPYSEKLELSVLGTIMKLPELFDLSMRYLNAKGMFYNEQHAEVWEVMKDLGAAKGGFVPQMLESHFEATRDKGKIAFVKCLAHESDMPSHFVRNCLKLNEYWIQRVLVRMGHYLNANALKKGIDSLDLMGVASDGLAKIYAHIAKMKESTLGDAVEKLSQQIVAITNSTDKIIGLRSSLEGLNRVIRGYRKGNLIVVAASTSEGKSTLAFQEILFMAENGVPVGVCLLEMTTDEFLMILACNKMGITTEVLLDGLLSPEQHVEFGRVLSVIKALPIRVTDKPGLRLSEIKAIGRMWKKQSDIQMLYVDHMHLAQDDINQPNPEQRFTNIANGLKELAKELDIPLMALAQLARKEVSDQRAHRVTDLKYAGGIEQAADVILLIFRPEHHGIDKDMDGNSTAGYARIIIGKLRLLPKRDVKCTFTGLRFLDKDPFQQPVKHEHYKPNAGMPNRLPDNFFTDETPF